MQMQTAMALWHEGVERQLRCGVQPAACVRWRHRQAALGKRRAGHSGPLPRAHHGKGQGVHRQLVRAACLLHRRAHRLVEGLLKWFRRFRLKCWECRAQPSSRLAVKAALADAEHACLLAGLIRGLPTFTLLFQILACMIESLALPLCMHDLLYDNLYPCVQTCVYFFLSFGKALWQSYKVMQPPQIAANCGTTVVYASERFGSSRHPRLKHSEVQPVGPAGCTATAAGRQSCQLQGRPPLQRSCDTI